MKAYTAHQDTFARDHLPPPEQWPTFKFDLPGLKYPSRLNCASELLDQMARKGFGDRTALITPHERWTYRQLLEKSNQVAHVLTEDFGLVSGNRVLIRGANNPMFVACWLGIAKAGGIVVATMPLLRAKELSIILDKALVKYALCDEQLKEEMEKGANAVNVCERVCYFNGSGGAGGELEERMMKQPRVFENIQTASDDPALIAFTSGTTGKPKAAVHFHRDILAMCDTYSKHILKPTAKDVVIGSPPIAFTFGLGGLVAFPLRVGASTVLLETGAPDKLLAGIAQFKPTICFTSPTSYRMMAGQVDALDLTSLKKCVSAGEALPLATFELWKEKTGLSIMDGVGSTEMIHIFIAAIEEEIRPGATGKPVPGYEAMVADEQGNPLPPGQIGRLAVRGPTGCKYLADARQTEYVQNGWNYTGDAYKMDADGYFWFQARADDMIISGGYNIAGPEVEGVLLEHPAVAECAVVGAPDETRGFIVKAFVVARPSFAASPELAKDLQEFVKKQIAPYKYPRSIEFINALPKTETGKVQRFKLRQQEMEKHQ